MAANTGMMSPRKATIPHVDHDVHQTTTAVMAEASDGKLRSGWSYKTGSFRDFSR